MDTLLQGLRAAAEPTRLRLLALCARAELSVGELTHILGQSQPRVSRHLKLLCDAGLLDRSREGTHAYYRIAADPVSRDLVQFLVDQVPPVDATMALDGERLDAVKRERAERAAEYFRLNAAEWDQIRSLHTDEAEVERRLLSLLPPGRIGDFLDVGTGTGRILALLAGRVGRAVGLDSSREMLAVARANLEQAGHDNCRVSHGDMYQLPWPAASYDALTIHQVLRFADAPGEVIAEAARVLRPGGWLAVIDFAPHDLEHLRHDHAHRWLGFDDREIMDWYRAAGLEPAEPARLPGDPLTVVIWTAVKRASRGSAAARAETAEVGR